MGPHTCLVLLSTLLVSVLSLPGPGYNIPSVGPNTGRRAQYYVRHNDGSFKYGHDTGLASFESAHLGAGSQVRGKFGFVAEDDGIYREVQYEAGSSTGFTADADHLPVGPVVPGAPDGRPTGKRTIDHHIQFNDPLANTARDASFGFGYSSDSSSRNEQSDSDGTVRGSYSYIGDDGVKRTYSYTAGKGIGFVVEGTDLPQQPSVHGSTPSGTRFTGSHLGQSKLARGTSSVQGSSSVPPGTSYTGYSNSPSKFIGTGALPLENHYFAPSTGFNTKGLSSSFITSTKFGKRPEAYEISNVRSGASPDGAYSFGYQTSSQSRSESADRNNNVKGEFSFRADDTGRHHEIDYIAGSSTGFVVEGSHLPVGPVVPGAPDGRPTGKKTSEHYRQFVDPLANTASDASYSYSFDTETYSRSESADRNGNVQGSYTIVDDDGTRNIHNFIAGKGTGVVTNQVGTFRGPRPSVATTSSSIRGSHGARGTNLAHVSQAARGSQSNLGSQSFHSFTGSSKVTSPSYSPFNTNSGFFKTNSDSSTTEVFADGTHLTRYNPSNSANTGYVLTTKYGR